MKIKIIWPVVLAGAVLGFGFTMHKYVKVSGWQRENNKPYLTDALNSPKETRFISSHSTNPFHIGSQDTIKMNEITRDLAFDLGMMVGNRLGDQGITIADKRWERIIRDIREIVFDGSKTTAERYHEIEKYTDQLIKESEQ